MDAMKSSEFRTKYASLEGPVRVTVNGHTIGTWFPGPDDWDEVDLGDEPQPIPKAVSRETSYVDPVFAAKLKRQGITKG